MDRVYNHIMLGWDSWDGLGSFLRPDCKTIVKPYNMEPSSQQ